MVGLDPTISGQLGKDGRVRPDHDGVTVSYAVKEIFHTLQGEGGQAGRA